VTSSLRTLLLGLSSVAIVAVTLSGLAVNLRDRSTAASLRLSEQTQRLAAAAAPVLLDSLVIGDLARAEQTLRNLNADSVWSRVALYEADARRLIFDASPERLRQSDAPRWVKHLLPVALDEHRVAITAPPVVYGILAVTPSMESLENELWSEIRTMTAVTGVLLVTLVGLTHVILLVGLRPVRALAESAARLGSGDLTARMPETRLSEMAPTVRAFNSMAASLEQALHEARTRETRLQSLVEISGHLSRMQEVDSLLGRIAEACGRLVNTDWVGFRLVDGDELVIAGTGGGSQYIVTPRLRIGASLAGVVAATGRPLVVRDPADDPRVLPPHAAAMRRVGSRAFMGVPAKAGDRVVGVLSFQTRRDEGFSAEDVAFATAFAAHAAIALENSRLLLESRRAYVELAETQGQLEQAQKMDAIGRLAGGVAHDFNNLLTVILGRTDILLHPLKPDDPMRRGIELIQRTAGRAADLTRQLLAFSRKQVLDAVVLDLGAVTTDMKDMLGRLIGEDIALLTAPTPGLGRVKADRGQIEQVIMNLAVNARDSMPQGGRLILETANVDLDDEYVRRHVGARPGPHVMLAVSDTGAGIPREIQGQIFEPFFTTKEPGKGTGLGLATVYGIVKQSGGYIEVDSEAGRGTTFRIYLPRLDAAPVTVDRSGRPTIAAGGTETILLVEDEEGVRELARDILRASGYTVLEARNGAEALLLCERHQGPLDMLLTDVVMPRMSGRELAERLAPLRPDLSVLYMSGYTDDAVIRHGVLRAGTAFLQKPFTPAALVQRVRETLDLAAAPHHTTPV
jgi:signal transduction histidine kinase/ActR/RegA family two-component response regulator/HAMP domain-containing protein